MCRYMSRGVKEACCINFGVMSEIIDKLPRFVPEKEKYHLTRDEAVARFREHNAKGYIGTIWYGPFPYINNLCSCESPECAGIRPRVDFGIKSIYKAEYLIELNEAVCYGLRGLRGQVLRSGPCAWTRRWTARWSTWSSCYGCGVCRHACATGALFLVPRDDVPAFAGKY